MAELSAGPPCGAASAAGRRGAPRPFGGRPAAAPQRPAAGAGPGSPPPPHGRALPRLLAPPGGGEDPPGAPAAARCPPGEAAGPPPLSPPGSARPRGGQRAGGAAARPPPLRASRCPPPPPPAGGALWYGPARPLMEARGAGGATGGGAGGAPPQPASCGTVWRYRVLQRLSPKHDRFRSSGTEDGGSPTPLCPSSSSLPGHSPPLSGKTWVQCHGHDQKEYKKNRQQTAVFKICLLFFVGLDHTI